jgi:hypothetical protein
MKVIAYLVVSIMLAAPLSPNKEVEQLVTVNEPETPAFVNDPLMLNELSADTHTSEEWIPQVPKTPEGVRYEAPTTTTTTTTTTTVPLPEGKCSEWYDVALEAGWEYDQLTKLGAIIWAESRCTADIANKTYSYGLAQMEWSAHKHWLASEFGITEREALFDPYTNLLVAKWLFDYADTHYGCGWQPWYMSGDWC